MTEDDFHRSIDLFRCAGFRVEEKRYDKKCFGSWLIEVAREGHRTQRVVFDGKDGWLIVQAVTSTGAWADRWIGRKKSEQTPDAALSQLALPVTIEWEEQVERQQQEYWEEFQLEQAKFQLEQAVSLAAQLWDAGCYSDYVRELSPFRDQLSPAQLKRLDIAAKRAAER